MPRQARLDAPGTLHHVIVRGIEKRRIVDDDPAPPERATETSSENAQAQGAPARMSWARLLKRVFDIDIEHCPNCGGALKIIAWPRRRGGPSTRLRTDIEDPPVIDKILSHLGLPTRAPPRAPARRVDLFQTI